MVIKEGTKTYAFFKIIAWAAYGKTKRYAHLHYPNTLCSAFWWVLGGLIALMFKTTIILSAAVVALVIVSIIVLTPIYLWFPFSWGGNFFADSVAITISMVCWIGIGMIAIGVYRETDHFIDARNRQKQRKIEKFVDSGVQEKSDTLWTLIVEYAKSGKSKICPTIQYEYERNND